MMSLISYLLMEWSVQRYFVCKNKNIWCLITEEFLTLSSYALQLPGEHPQGETDASLLNGGWNSKRVLFGFHLNGGLVCAYFRPNCMPRHTSHIVRHHKPTLNEWRAGWISLLLATCEWATLNEVRCRGSLSFSMTRADEWSKIHLAVGEKPWHASVDFSFFFHCLE